jgi:low temperature requirement protein LtrA
MAHGQWWQRPQLIVETEGDRERRVSWLELFFDLIFVVVIAELSHYLSAHVSIAGVLGYALLFVAAWWAWIGGTFYNARFETGDVSYRLLVYLHMLPVAGMAVFAHDALGKTSTQFALAYVAVRLVVIFLWLRGGWHAPVFRPISNRYAIGFSISVLLFIASVFVAPPLRFGLWGLGLACDLITPVTTFKFQARLPHLSNSKLPERYGLFVIIVLGEATVGVIRGLAEQESLSFITGLRGALCMALVFGLWWVYFDFITRHVEFRQPRPGLWMALARGYLHLPLVMGIAAVSAGASNLLAHETLEPGVRWLIAASIAVALAAIGLIELTLQREPGEPTDLRVSFGLKIAGAFIALVIGAWGAGLGPTALLAGLLIPLLIQMTYGAYAWFHTPSSGIPAETQLDTSEVTSVN